jgi:hypothetical protein
VPHDTTPELPPPKSCQSATASSIQFEGISVAIEQPQIGPGRLQRSLAKNPLALARQNARAKPNVLLFGHGEQKSNPSNDVSAVEDRSTDCAPTIRGR